MTNYITVKLTEDQLDLILDCLTAAWWNDKNPQTTAVKQRVYDKLAKLADVTEPINNYEAKTE